MLPARRQADHPVRRSRRRWPRASTNIIIVTGRGKNAIEDHFDVSYELEQLLEQRGKTDLLEQVRAISNMINVSYVRQRRDAGAGPRGADGAATWSGDEPFAVMLGDDIIDSDSALHAAR